MTLAAALRAIAGDAHRECGWNTPVVKTCFDAANKLESIECRQSETTAALTELRAAVTDYLAEFDNPVPDVLYRRQLREKLRDLVLAPAGK